MSVKKLIVPAILVIFCIAFAIGVFLIMELRRSDNVFDEMYQSVNNPKTTNARFGFVRSIGGIVQPSDLHDFYMASFEKSMLEKGEDIFLTICTRSNTISIMTKIEIENSQCLYYRYNYNYSTKTLTIQPITVRILNYIELEVESFVDNPTLILNFIQENNISHEFIEQYRDYFLYEKLLTDWIIGNGERSLFTIGNYGEFTLIDNTFEDLKGFE
jgi:hypothetical protein